MGIDLLFVFGLNGSINNLNPSAGFSTGLKMKNDLVSFGGNVGMDASYKESVTYNAEANASYNGEDGTNNYKDGLFANGAAKYKMGIGSERTYGPYNEPYDDPKINSGVEYSAELGYRFNSYKSVHTNLSLVADVNTFGDDKSSYIAGKYELSDGNKAMSASVGLKQNGENVEPEPYVGVAAKIGLGF